MAYKNFTGTRVFSPDNISIAAEIIKSGGLVAFPTETVYGLGANALNPEAVENIFRAKGRPADNPLIVHIAEISDIKKYSENLSEKAKMLMEKFWPGPLAIILKKSREIPDIVSAGLDTAAFRMPGHQIALDLIRKSGLPIAAPSANTSGRPSPTDAAHVLEDLSGKIDAVIDAGPVHIGIESTVIDMSGDMPAILRPGKISAEEIEEVIGKIEVIAHFGDTGNAPPAPGMKYRHYSPFARVEILEDESEMFRLARDYISAGKRVAAVIDSDEKVKSPFIRFYRDYNHLANELFRWFRDFDDAGAEVILIKRVKKEGIGNAIMNRLEKAASK